MAWYSGTIHPGTIKQGYLTKSPPLEKKGLLNVKGWKKRWCIFSRANGEEPCLNYYRTEEDSFSSLPIKRVNLKRCFKVEMDLTHSNHKNIFAIHLPERIYYFSAPSQIEMSEWSDALCTHLGLMSTVPNMYMESKRATTLPADSSYGSLTYGRSRAPNSPLPPIPSGAGILPPSPSRSPQPPPHASPLPPHVSPLLPPPHGHSLPPLSGPPVPPYSPVMNEHYMSPSTSSPSRSPQLPLHSPVATPAPPVPSHSPQLPHHMSPPHRSHIAPPPKLPQRSHSPSADIAPQQPADTIACRPPAPPPKQSPLVSPQESFDLEEAPPTPPPRPRDKPTFSPPLESTSTSSNSDDDDALVPPPLPPRLD